jgi:hypothetical protein
VKEMKNLRQEWSERGLKIAAWLRYGQVLTTPTRNFAAPVKALDFHIPLAVEVGNGEGSFDAKLTKGRPPHPAAGGQKISQ